MLFLRLADFPELAGLSDAQRCEMIRRIPRSSRVRLMGLPLLFGVMFGLFVSDAQGADGWNIVLAIAAGLLVACITRVLMLVYVRAGLAAALHEAQRAGIVTVCLNCGYDLQGVADRCPECGKRVGGSDD